VAGRDLTQGPVRAHVLHLSSFIALSTLFQTLYFVVDLYFVGRLGKEAVAGVALAGNLLMVVLALSQTVGVGATTFIAQALGRRDRDRAELVFNQTLVFSAIVGVLFGVIMGASRLVYARGLAADDLTAQNGIAYLNWYIPAMALQFLMVGMGAALRGAGDLKMPTVIQIATVLLNIVLTPALMFGWVTGVPLGVAGTAIASFISVVVALVAFTGYFLRPASLLKFLPGDWLPKPALWWSMLRVGLPVGGEFAILSVYLVLVYSVLKPFGASAQAGFGIGLRVMQSLFLPAVAIGFATAPVAGQNFGAGHGPRVRETFLSAVTLSSAVMVLATALCQIAPASLVRFFNADPGVVAAGGDYLRIVSWTFVASGVIFVSSSVFQGMGNTLPALVSSVMRLLTFAAPVYWMSHRPWFQIRHVWYLSAATVVVHVSLSVWLLHREFDRRLPPAAAPIAAG
jgi:putative MATE family efflux protein